LYDN